MPFKKIYVELMSKFKDDVDNIDDNDIVNFHTTCINLLSCYNEKFAKNFISF